MQLMSRAMAGALALVVMTMYSLYIVSASPYILSRAIDVTLSFCLVVDGLPPKYDTVGKTLHGMLSAAFYYYCSTVATSSTTTGLIQLLILQLLCTWSIFA